MELRDFKMPKIKFPKIKFDHIEKEFNKIDFEKIKKEKKDTKKRTTPYEDRTKYKTVKEFFAKAVKNLFLNELSSSLFTSFKNSCNSWFRVLL